MKQSTDRDGLEALISRGPHYDALRLPCRNVRARYQQGSSDVHSTTMSGWRSRTGPPAIRSVKVGLLYKDVHSASTVRLMRHLPRDCAMPAKLHTTSLGSPQASGFQVSSPLSFSSCRPSSSQFPSSSSHPSSISLPMFSHLPATSHSNPGRAFTNDVVASSSSV